MLKKLNFTPFTANELKPDGWLRRQLEIQARGLSGNLDKIWPDVRDSKWIGGDREGWERVPYWLDGFIPLAWLLDDEGMKARATKYMDAILTRQQEDGWICPCGEDERGRYDMWALYLICKVMVMYHDCTGDPRIEDAVYKALYRLSLHIEQFTVFNWAAARWYECLISISWLYERRPEDWLLDLAHTLEEQGIDYEKNFKNWRYGQPGPRGRWSHMTHIVNLGMMIKSRALFSRISGEDGNEFAKLAVDALLRDHGTAAEHFNGDECLAGTSPIRGTELCSVVEAMYSYEWLIAITGRGEWSDMLEYAAFNSLPATISPDMWTHQYDQMANQIQCSKLPADKIHFGTNSAESHLFGLEPNFGCCTANFNQGWPKFALSTMMACEGGIVVTAIAPSRLKTKIDGVDVMIHIATDYPFDDSYTVTVETSAPVEFTLYLRIPGSVKSAIVSGVSASAGFYPVRRLWSGTVDLTVSMEFVPELRRRPGGMYCVWRGPLLYSLPIKEEWRKLEYVANDVERKFPYCDYEIYPLSKWNYGFSSDKFVWEKNEIGDVPFRPESPPCALNAEMAEIDWGSENGVCAEKPECLTPKSEVQAVKLIPYGCTNLRIAEAPALFK